MPALPALFIGVYHYLKIQINLKKYRVQYSITTESYKVLLSSIFLQIIDSYLFSPSAGITSVATLPSFSALGAAAGRTSVAA